MWRCVKRPVRALKEDGRSSLMAGWGGGGYVTYLCSSVNHFKNDLILAVHQKSYNG